jgi:hypothetical protein
VTEQDQGGFSIAAPPQQRPKIEQGINFLALDSSGLAQKKIHNLQRAGFAAMRCWTGLIGCGFWT